MSFIRKSKIDQRIYKSLELPNKLSCLLISDQETEKSAAALNVNVGSLEDPIDRLGLAHFCEHMLFMGTKKFPDEAEYQNYITKNAGDTNAYTAQLQTNYMFQVSNNALQGALERFSQFFTEPLFDPSCTEREMKAVDSEYNMNLQSDFWRKHQLLCHHAKEGSAMKKFSIGNLKTLSHEDIRNRLLDFHKQYYSANLMKLVVYGKQPVDELELWTKELFSNIENKGIEAPTYKNLPYEKENCGKIIRYVPFKDEDYLDLVWFIDNLEPHYMNCPGSYISHLIGHEGKNSLLSVLIDEGLAQELSCGPDNEMRLYSTMHVRIKLTKKGLTNIATIINFIFQYVNMLKEKGTQKWIFEEKQIVRQLQFQYLEKSRPFRYVSELSARLQKYPIDQVLQGPYLMENYDENLIQSTINQLNTDNLIVMVSSKEFSGKLGENEAYFNTEFKTEPFDDILRENMLLRKVIPSKKQIDLPLRNIFLPKNTDLNPIEQNEPVQQPVKVFAHDQSELWFKRDNRFGVPKAVVQVIIYTNDCGYGEQSHTEVLARLWLDILNDHIRELNYLADMAYLSPNVNLVPFGIDIQVSGFSDSMQPFLQELFNQIRSFKIEDYRDKIEAHILKQKQKLENFKRSSPYQQVMLYQNVVLKQGGSFDPDVLLQEINNIRYEDILNFNQKWLTSGRFHWFITGNIPQNIAQNIVETTQNIMKLRTLPKEQVLEQRTIHMPIGKTYNFSYNLNEETNSAVLLYYQHENLTLRSQLLNDLLANLLKSPFFTQLRTQEQLGYAVFSMVSDIRGITGFNFLIQSNSKSPEYCQQRIRLFINQQMLESVKKMTSEEFETYKQSVRTSLLEKDYSLNTEFGKQWTEILRNQFIFDRRAKLLEILDTITQDETIQYYEQLFLQNPKVMEIHAISHKHKDENDELRQQTKTNTIISYSSQWLKRRLPLYPDYYSLL